MSDIVIDCPLAMRWLYEDEADAESDEIYRDLHAGVHRAVVPGRFYLEVMNTLLGGEKKDRTTPAESATFDETILSPPITGYAPSPSDLLEVMQLARQHGLTAYDAVYPHLSVSRGLPLHSHDKTLVGARYGSPME